MKKFLLFFVTAFLLTGCMLSGAPQTAKTCDDKAEQFMKDNCYLQMTVNDHEKSNCEKIFDSQKKADCYLEVAVGTLDIGACDAVTGYRKEKCITDFSNQGFANGVSDCQQQEDVDRCLAHQAGVRQNPRYCAKSSDYNACIAELMKNTPADRLPCENVEGDERINCVVAMAENLDDPTFCKELKEESDLKVCEERMKSEKTQAAAMYANMICVLSDPAVWEDMFDDKSAEEEALDEAETLRLYSEYGYSGEAEARAALEEMWGSESFINSVKETVSKDCPAAISTGGVDVDALLNSSVDAAFGS